MSRLTPYAYTVGAEEAKADEKPEVNTSDVSVDVMPVPFLNRMLIPGLENKWLVLGVAGLAAMQMMRK